MAEQSNPGEQKAWEILASLDPASVCRAASASYDSGAAAYRLTSFGMEFVVSVRDRAITSEAAGSELLLRRLGYFFRLSVLWYLASAKDIACTNRLVKLEQVRGGEIFSKGSHILPLDQLAKRYGRDKEGLLARGAELGAEAPPLGVGDAVLRLYPLPRIPVVLAFWLEDDEFPARADLLFDSTCGMQLPTDILWSAAMMTALAMLGGSPASSPA